MKVVREINISEFEFWSDAVYTFESIVESNKVEELEQLIEEQYPNGIGETELNDLLWFEEDWIFEMLGMKEEEEEEEEEEPFGIWKRKNGERVYEVSGGTK